MLQRLCLYLFRESLSRTMYTIIYLKINLAIYLKHIVLVYFNKHFAQFLEFGMLCQIKVEPNSKIATKTN